MLALDHTRKTCFACGAEKPISDFYRHPQTSDGHMGKCKECQKAASAAARAARPEYYRDCDRRRFQENPERRARQLASMRANFDPAKKREAQRKYRAMHPEKQKAVRALKYAVRAGNLAKPGTCEICASTDRIHGHHHDYSKPLDVWWLCDHCHKLLHRLIRSAMRKSEAA